MVDQRTSQTVHKRLKGMTVTVTEVDAVFSAALELPSAQQRAEYVDRLCGDNAELRA
jgi:hypothetical protein